jgi:iron complex transport system permease protein
MNISTRGKRRKLAFIIGIILFAAGCIYGLSSGSVPISPVQIWEIIVSEGEPAHAKILFDLRLPRVVIGLLVGACLAASGALLQGVMRNPLADPAVIGVSSGAGLAAIITMILLPQYSYLLPVTAFFGAFVTALVIYLIAWDKGVSPLKIILAGVAVNALFSAAQSGIMVLYSDRVQSVLSWLAGGLNGRSWNHLQFMLPYALIGLVLTVLAIKPSNLLLLGDDSAKLLGQKVEAQRFLLIVLAAFLAGTAVSVAGLISFVGLVVPHAVRLVIGEDYRYLLPLSIISGASLVVIADTIARSWFDPVELPAGILLAFLGAPFFLFLLKKRSMI